MDHERKVFMQLLTKSCQYPFDQIQTKTASAGGVHRDKYAFRTEYTALNEVVTF